MANDYGYIVSVNYLEHHGILGMKWGQRRFQNEDGSLTAAGRDRYGVGDPKKKKPFAVVVLGKKAKNTVNTNKADSGDNKAETAKQAKVHGPRHFGTRSDKKQPLTEEERKALVRSGDIKKILSRASELDPQEMTSAIQRARDIEQLKTFNDRDEQRQESLASKAKAKLNEFEENRKQKILRSGDIDKIIDNQDKFSTQELNDALNRQKSKAALEEQRKIEKRANSLLGKALSVATRSIDLLDKVSSAKEKVDSLFNKREEEAVDKMSPTDMLANLATASNRQIKAMRERSESMKNIANNLKDSVLGFNKDYDLSGKDMKDLGKAFKNASTPGERKAILDAMEQQTRADQYTKEKKDYKLNTYSKDQLYDMYRDDETSPEKREAIKKELNDRKNMVSKNDSKSESRLNGDRGQNTDENDSGNKNNKEKKQKGNKQEERTTETKPETREEQKSSTPRLDALREQIAKQQEREAREKQQDESVRRTNELYEKEQKKTQESIDIIKKGRYSEFLADAFKDYKPRTQKAELSPQQKETLRKSQEAHRRYEDARKLADQTLDRSYDISPSERRYAESLINSIPDYLDFDDYD